MVLDAGDDRNMHRLDDWKVCFAGAINPVDKRGKHSVPYMEFLPFEVLLDEPIGECLWVVRRSCGRSSQRNQQKECGNVSDAIPPYFRRSAATATMNNANATHFSRCWILVRLSNEERREAISSFMVFRCLCQSSRSAR